MKVGLHDSSMRGREWNIWSKSIQQKARRQASVDLAPQTRFSGSVKRLCWISSLRQNFQDAVQGLGDSYKTVCLVNYIYFFINQQIQVTYITLGKILHCVTPISRELPWLSLSYCEIKKFVSNVWQQISGFGLKRKKTPCNGRKKTQPSPSDHEISP